ncbi:chorismate mutase [Pelagibius litoralis]|uniref:chorismate mutase n=1 Tax=Pelagibius litoralis TaxID=374515 RepID=A0A967C2J3_9PROT|nr:chorismate mutase [Pelagibius litoralis]NIA68408.1 chorismate mutase [Pelagibius litoralis]
MSEKPTSLDDLRRKIDEIDNSLHDLLMRRTELARQIALAKGSNAVIMRPGREARVLRRLVGRHQGPFPKPVISRIWREIISVFTRLQGPFAAAAFAPEGGSDLSLLARDHFGSLTPITSYGSEMGVLRAVSDGKANIGILPLPESDRGTPWWPKLARSGKASPKIIARLPFAALDGGRRHGPEAVVVSLAEPEESGDDQGYLIVELDEAVSRGALKTLLSDAGFEVRNTQAWVDAPDRPLHLVEVEGFLASDDARVAALVAETDQVSHAWAVGSFAVPLTAEDLANSPAPSTQAENGDASDADAASAGVS